MPAPVDTEGKTGPCQCADLVNALEPDRERCLIVCGATVSGKNLKCRPCALGNHTGEPCRQNVPDYPRNLVKTCAECGFDGWRHEVGSDGRPN